MPSDIFSGYFSDDSSDDAQSNDIYSSYFPEDTTPKEDTSTPGVILHSLNAIPAGLQSGVANMLMEGAKGASWGANKLGIMPDQTYDNVGQGIKDFRGSMDEEVSALDPLSKGMYEASQYIPAMIGTGPVGTPFNAAAKAASGSKLAQIGLSGISNGLQAGAINSLNPSGSSEDAADRIRKGTEWGAGLGAGVPAAMIGGAKLADMVTSKVEPEAAGLAMLAKDKYGIDLSAPQISNSPFMKYLDSATGTIPLSGGAAKSEEQYSQLTKAIANTFGGKDLTQDGMSEARKNIRNMYNSVSKNTVMLGDSKLTDGLNQVAQDAEQTDVGSKLKPIIDNINNRFDENGFLSGKDYKSLTAKGTPLDRLMQSSDPNVRFYAGQIGDYLDSALARAASPQDAETLNQADRMWKNMKTVEGVASKQSSDGSIPLTGFRNAVIKSFKDYPYSGGGDLGELAKIAQFMKPPPSSGTAERALAYASTIFPAERLMRGDIHGAAMDAASAGAIMGSSKMVQMGLNSEWYKNALINSALSGGSSYLDNVPNMIGSSSIPAIATAGNRLIQQPTTE